MRKHLWFAWQGMVLGQLTLYHYYYEKQTSLYSLGILSKANCWTNKSAFINGSKN